MKIDLDITLNSFHVFVVEKKKKEKRQFKKQFPFMKNKTHA